MFSYEHAVQGLGCTKGMYLHKLLEAQRHYWAQFELLQISSWPDGSRGLETLFKAVTNTSAGVYFHTNEVFTSSPPNSPCTGQGEPLLLCTWLGFSKKKQQNFFRPLGFYLFYLFLQRGKIHLCSAVLRKYIRPLKYHAEMLIEKCIMHRKQYQFMEALQNLPQIIQNHDTILNHPFWARPICQFCWQSWFYITERYSQSWHDRMIVLALRLLHS